MAGALERLGSARLEVERVCDWLVRPSPDALDRCPMVLESAAAGLSDGASWLSLARGDPEALAEAWRLRRAVRRAGRLLENAADYHKQWNRTLAGIAGGYRPDGEPAEVAHAGRISLLG